MEWFSLGLVLHLELTHAKLKWIFLINFTITFFFLCVRAE